MFISAINYIKHLIPQGEEVVFRRRGNEKVHGATRLNGVIHTVKLYLFYLIALIATEE